MLTKEISKSAEVWLKAALWEDALVCSLMENEEWAFFAPFLVGTGAGSGRPPSSHRRILGGVFWTARTGVPSRELHEHFGK